MRLCEKRIFKRQKLLKLCLYNNNGPSKYKNYISELSLISSKSHGSVSSISLYSALAYSHFLTILI